jgi:hypothetical protein
LGVRIAIRAAKHLAYRAEGVRIQNAKSNMRRLPIFPEAIVFVAEFFRYQTQETSSHLALTHGGRARTTTHRLAQHSDPMLVAQADIGEMIIQPGIVATYGTINAQSGAQTCVMEVRRRETPENSRRMAYEVQKESQLDATPGTTRRKNVHYSHLTHLGFARVAFVCNGVSITNE